MEKDSKMEIKLAIVGLIETSSITVQRQLCDTMINFDQQHIAIDDLIDILYADNFQARFGALLALHSVLKPYRERICGEKEKITEMIAEPLTETLIFAMSRNNESTNRLLYEIILLATKVFRSLCLQSLLRYMGRTLIVWIQSFLEIFIQEKHVRLFIE